MIDITLSNPLGFKMKRIAVAITTAALVAGIGIAIPATPATAASWHTSHLMRSKAECERTRIAHVNRGDKTRPCRGGYAGVDLWFFQYYS